MKTAIAALLLTAAPALADGTTAIDHFNQDHTANDVVRVLPTITAASTRGDDHSDRAAAIFARIAAESAEDE